MTDESLTLEQRVASLEEALLYPLRTIQPSSHDFTEHEAAEFRRELEAVLENGPHELRVLPQPPPLTPGQVRQLLRECVTVVKPGEVLILRAPDGWTPEQVREVARSASAWLEHNAPEIRALAIPPMEMVIVPAGSVVP